MKDRYQFQPWYIKLWRRRYYFEIPFSTLYTYFKSNLKLKSCYRLNRGIAHTKMNWVYDGRTCGKKN